MKRLTHMCVALLATWYLIRAPMHQGGVSSHFGMRFADTNAPLSKWSIIGKFDAAQPCEAEIVKRTAKQREGFALHRQRRPPLSKVSEIERAKK